MSASPGRFLCRALGRATNVTLATPERSTELLKGDFGSVDPAVTKRAMDNLKPAFPPDGRMTPEQWKNAADAALEAEVVKTLPNSAEGGVWTNKYLVNIPKS